MEPFIKQQSNDLILYRLPHWTHHNSGISAGFSSRIGGVSPEPWDSLNCAFHVDDQPERVIQNRKKIADALGFSFDTWTCAEQIHSHDVYRVTERDVGKGRESREDAIQGKDALITNAPGVLLTSFYADCVPLYFFDPIVQAVGLAHAGWKGTVSSIAEVTIQAMVNEFGCQLEHIQTAIGPSIGSCCYEVDDTVMDQVKKNDLARGIEKKSNGRYGLDLKEMNRKIMIKAGIMPTHIEISSLCTACNPQTFYSHRRDRGLTGRMISWIGIQKR